MIGNSTPIIHIRFGYMARKEKVKIMTTYMTGIVAALYRDLETRFNETGSTWNYTYELGQIKYIEQYVDNDDFNHFFYNRLQQVLPTLTAEEKADSEAGLEIAVIITGEWEYGVNK